ncbi:MAG: hypothetical protein IJV32_05775 [Bacteroidales bacterium]|nr:hypothetical protein [Bacteroidales bacterium]
MKRILFAFAACLLALSCTVTSINDTVDNTMIVGGNTYYDVLPLYTIQEGYVNIDINHPAGGDDIHGHGGFSAAAIGRTINADNASDADKILLMSFNFLSGAYYDMALVSGTQSVRRDGNNLIVRIDGKDANGKRFFLNAYVYDEVEFWATHPGGVDARWEPGL